MRAASASLQATRSAAPRALGHRCWALVPVPNRVAAHQSQDLAPNRVARLRKGLRADRQRALLCVACETLARRGELVSLEVRDIDFHADGTGLVLIRRGKTDAAGRGGPLTFRGRRCDSSKLAHAKVREGTLRQGKSVCTRSTLPTRPAYWLLKRRVGIDGAFLDTPRLLVRDVSNLPAKSVRRRKCQTPPPQTPVFR